jgi:regulatory protein
LREHSRAELKKKLHTRFGDSSHIEPVLYGLEQESYLNDERFVEEYLSVRKRKGYGPLRIKAELNERGVGNEIISRYIEEQDTDWYTLMQQVAVSKGGSLGELDQKTQQKLARFLEYRGFPVSMIRRYLWDSD